MRYHCQPALFFYGFKDSHSSLLQDKELYKQDEIVGPRSGDLDLHFQAILDEIMCLIYTACTSDHSASKLSSKFPTSMLEDVFFLPFIPPLVRILRRKLQEVGHEISSFFRLIAFGNLCIVRAWKMRELREP